MGQSSSRESSPSGSSNYPHHRQRPSPPRRPLGRRPEHTPDSDALHGPGGRGIAENSTDTVVGGGILRGQNPNGRFGLGGQYGAIHTGVSHNLGGLGLGAGHEAYTSPLQKSAAMDNTIFIKKQSIKLKRSKENENVLLLEFEFKASVDGWITVYYVAKRCNGANGNGNGGEGGVNDNFGNNNNNSFELCEKGKLSFTGKVDRKPTKTRFRALDIGQNYRQKFEKGLDLRKYKMEDLVWRKGNKYFPIVIRLEADYPADYNAPVDKRVKSQTTFMTLMPERNCGDEYGIRLMKQQIVVDRNIYEVKEMYGIARSNFPTGQGDGKDCGGSGDGDSQNIGSYCVICLSEKSDTAVRPCNHLCLCSDCAKDLITRTRRCPICRERSEGLLRITNLNGGDTDGEDDDVNDKERSRSTVETRLLSESGSSTGANNGSVGQEDRPQQYGNYGREGGHQASERMYGYDVNFRAMTHSTVTLASRQNLASSHTIILSR